MQSRFANQCTLVAASIGAKSIEHKFVRPTVRFIVDSYSSFNSGNFSRKSLTDESIDCRDGALLYLYLIYLIQLRFSRCFVLHGPFFGA